MKSSTGAQHEASSSSCQNTWFRGNLRHRKRRMSNYVILKRKLSRATKEGVPRSGCQLCGLFNILGRGSCLDTLDDPTMVAAVFTLAVCHDRAVCGFPAYCTPVGANSKRVYIGEEQFSRKQCFGLIGIRSTRTEWGTRKRCWHTICCCRMKLWLRFTGLARASSSGSCVDKTALPC